jgi:protein tyrosine phosphatase (PTP) superfamily phosphohydrolase (DUF442 family)
MKKLILILTTALFAAGAIAEDNGSDSVVFIHADELSAGNVAPLDVRFVASGQPDEAVLSAIADAGFVAVVDLRTGKEDRGLDEQATINRLGMAYASLPIDRILENYEGRVLLHCGSGNRVGALFALREKLHGASSDDALAVGKAAGLTRLESVVKERLAEE